MKKLICFTSVLAFLCAALSGCVSIEFNGLYAQTPEVTDSSRTPQLETPGTVVLPTETPAPVPVSFDFDTVDLDGNAVNTREFAAEHELTLVNFGQHGAALASAKCRSSKACMNGFPQKRRRLM